jgi:hypothetical protein
MISKCNAEWAPKTFNLAKTLSPGDGYGRTTILPALFDDHFGFPMDSTRPITIGGGTWRQLFTTAGHQTVIAGVGAGNTIPEDFKVAWIGLAFPNKNQHITELKWQIGDRKYGRIDIEEMKGYNKPAFIFEEGFVIDEEQSFELYGFVEGPIPTHHDGYVGVHQRIVMLGAAYFKIIDKVLGNPGSPI